MWSDGAVVIVKKSGNPDMADAMERALVRKDGAVGMDVLTKNKIARLEEDQILKGELLYGHIDKKENAVKRFLQVSWACIYWLLFGEKE